MNSLKLIILITAFSTFLISCGQAPTASNPENSTRSRANSNPGANFNGSNVSLRDASLANKATPVTDPVEASANGNDLYSENCMICHKATGKGGKMTLEGKTLNVDDLTSAKIKAKSDEKLLAAIKNGVPDEGMPAFKGKLTDEQIKSIIEKIRTF